MNTPRVETVLGLSVRIVLSWVVILFSLNLMQYFLGTWGVFSFEEIKDESFSTFLVAMAGAGAVLICSTLCSMAESLKITILEEQEKHEEETKDEESSEDSH